MKVSRQKLVHKWGIQWWIHSKKQFQLGGHAAPPGPYYGPKWAEITCFGKISVDCGRGAPGPRFFLSKGHRHNILKNIVRRKCQECPLRGLAHSGPQNNFFRKKFFGPNDAGATLLNRKGSSYTFLADSYQIRASCVIWGRSGAILAQNPKFVKNQYFGAIFFFKRVGPPSPTPNIYSNYPCAARGPPAPRFGSFFQKIRNFAISELHRISPQNYSSGNLWPSTCWYFRYSVCSLSPVPWFLNFSGFHN